MCFSATASFAAAGFAGSAGALTLSRAARAREVPLAGIPLLFATQQAIEGALWLTLPHDAAQALVLANAFALIALVLWPLYAPATAAAAEDDEKRRGLILWLLPLGAAFALYSGYDIAHHPYRAVRAAHSLCYINNSPYPDFAIGVYVLATCGGFLLSTQRALRAFGLIVTTGLAVSLAFYLEDVVSVWCFFAAAASVTLLFHFYQRVTVAA
ncbi:MAG TPA: DUF6629 family protein [Rhizomicrobium sp.]|nr:DUF6629 family protein [Rhizomicrobium sp.]